MDDDIEMVGATEWRIKMLEELLVEMLVEMLEELLVETCLQKACVEYEI